MNKISRKMPRAVFAAAAVATLALTACGGGGTGSSSNAGAGNFPTREVTMVVPYAAGGPTDISARTLAKGMETSLGKTVVVENRPGASGITGLSEVATAKNDGYTIVYSTGNSWEQSKLRQTPYTFDSFIPIAGVMTQPYLLVAGKDAKYKTWDAMTKATAPITMSLSGVGTTGHVNMEILFNQLGLKSQAVPFDGAGPAVQALVGGQTDVSLIDASVAMPFVKSGDLVVLGVMNPDGDKPLSYLPDAPTFESKGVDMAELSYTKYGVAAPKGTNEEVVKKLRDAVLASTSGDEFKKFSADTYTPLLTGEGESNWYKDVEAQADKTKASLDKFGIKLQ